MLEILAIMTAGILIGRLTKSRKAFLALIEKLIVVSIFLLLFFLGAGIGGDEEILKGLDTLGLNAFIIASGAVAGSLFAAWVLWKWLFANKFTTPS